MVVLAASICTKAGKAVISRQFREMTRTRIESLLASFPKLIPTNTQHTSVETSEVRYVYQPLEDLYIVLITNKASNILQDIKTLHLFARIVSDLCRSADEREILKNSLELLGAFDEVVSLGYHESVNLVQVRSILEMESHEEKIQEIISRNKEAEAKEELKRRAKQLEMQRREQQRRPQAGGGSSYLGGGITGYSPVPKYDTPDSVPARTASPAAPSSTLRAPAFKGTGMKLGSKKNKQAELLDALGGELVVPEPQALPELSAPSTPAAPVAPTLSTRGSMPEVTPESIHVSIKEHLSLSLPRDGGVQSMELKGEMNLTISDPSLGRIKLLLGPSTNDLGSSLQIKQHPNVSKFTPAQKEKFVALKDSSKSFPIGASLAVLKWRYTGTDESNVPLSISCWPSANDGSCEVSMEYELENTSLTIYDLVVSIPLPSGSYPSVSQHTGSWSLNPSTHALDWTVPLINEEENNGSLVFNVSGDDAEAFFPIQCHFVAQGCVAGINVVKAFKVDEGNGGEGEVFSVDSVVGVDEYSVV